jgi:hypothetical protein
MVDNLQLQRHRSRENNYQTVGHRRVNRTIHQGMGKFLHIRFFIPALSATSVTKTYLDFATSAYNAAILICAPFVSEKVFTLDTVC